MNESEIYDALTEIFHDIFGEDCPALHPTLTANQVEGWDSFNNINIVVAVENRFQIRLPPREVDKLANVGDLVRAIQNRIK
jgi:acyl carrier protein